jgi:uncharacterized protein (DUF2141 family)
MPLLLGAVLGFTSHAQSKPQTHLSIHVRLDRDARGELAYLIFDSPAGFPGHPENAIRRGFLPIPSGAQEMHLEMDLPSGTYAISVYDDMNGNHKLDRNFLGIPREPVGASNNPSRRMGPPNFGDCSFRLGDESHTLFINLVRGS